MSAPDAGAQPPAEPAARAWDAAIAAGYLALAILVVGPLWRDPGGRHPETNPTDPAFFQWALVHAVRIFSHGENPLLTSRLNAPVGVNLMANTGMLGLTVPLAPVTALLGAPVAFTLLLTGGLAGTAWAWYHILSRHLVASRLAAAIGGGFAGFAPGMVNHANAHPNLIAQFLLPFILWRALAVRTIRHGVVLGLLVTWQALINEELLFLAAIAGLIFILAYGLRRDLIAERAQGIAVAACVAAVLLAYPLWVQFRGPASYRGLPALVRAYAADLASYPAFAKLSLVRHGRPSGLAPQPEENTFLGWPLLIVMVAAVALLWRRREVRALAVVGAVVAALSLGATITWHGRVLTTHGPWRLLRNLPLFDTVVPTRLGLVLIPIVALLLAYLIDRWRLAVVAVAAALIPIAPIPLPVTATAPVPAFFTSGDWRRYVPAGRSVVSADQTVWYGGVDAMRWANATGQGYPMVGGYFLGPDAAGRGVFGPRSRPTAALLAGIALHGGSPPVTQAQRDQAAADVRYWRAGLVVLGPGAPHAGDLRAVLEQLFGPGTPVDDVIVWPVS